jgi:cellulose synthase operon protein C
MSVEVPAQALAEIGRAYESGLYLRAYERAREHGPLRAWRGSAAQVLAGRLAMNLGAPRLGRSLHLRAGRYGSSDPEVMPYFARALAEARGPLAAWRFLERNGADEHDPDERRADEWAFRAVIASGFRDFETAEVFLRKAEALAPESAWICLERAQVLEAQDRYEEALAAARRSLVLQPLFRPAVQFVAQLLLVLDRATEAVDLLERAAERLESAAVEGQLASVAMELGRYDQAHASLDRCQALAPLAERALEQWLAGRRSDLASLRGDWEAAREWARQVKLPYFDGIVEALSRPGARARRVLLPVPYVRQHHMTCSPATLAAISRFWSKPIDHLALAREITYDGTYGHRARLWASRNGWTTREFRVTWDAAVALLDRGIPFTLVTVGPDASHEQAVVGYDLRRSTLLIRDPGQPLLTEALADALLRNQADSGPRGFVLVPADDGPNLEGLDLPDAELYEDLYEVQGALSRHDRMAAMRARDRLAAAAPEHLLTLQADYTIGSYDADPRAGLVWAEAVLRRFPESLPALRVRTGALRELGRLRELAVELRRLCEAPKPHAVFLDQYADLLSLEAGEADHALRLLERSLRSQPANAFALRAEGDLLWRQRRFEEARSLYRLAACVNDKDENLFRSYFVACRLLRRTEEAVAWLERRNERFGGSSSAPLVTLFVALEDLGRAKEGFEHLDRGLAARPDDGDLRLVAADAQLRYGRIARAGELLEEARGRSRSGRWLRVAAGLAAQRGDVAEALRRWREVASEEPLAVDAHETIARLLASTEGERVALEHLRGACERFPHHYGLHLLWYQWSRRESLETAERVLRHLLESCPLDAWARRELALVLADERREPEALMELAVAGALDPNHPSFHCVHGYVLAQAGQVEEARAAFRESLRLDVNQQAAIGGLLNLGVTPGERRDDIAFVRDEIVRQVLFGDTLFVYRERAGEILPAGEVLSLLRDALEARPDLWPAWMAVVDQLNDMGRPQEALALAREASDRFPLVGRVWLGLARSQERLGDGANEIAALDAAMLAPDVRDEAARRLAVIHAASGDLPRARALLEQAVARAGLDHLNLGGLASVTWESGERERAVELLERALAVEPGYEWAWSALAAWSAACGRADRAVELARDLTRRRPLEAASWLMLATSLVASVDLGERTAALERAVALAPRLIRAHDLRARLLAEAGRFDEALAACRPPAWGEAPPAELRGREAWVWAERQDLREALRRMEIVLAEEPNYLWGWFRLAEWQDKLGLHEKVLHTTERMVAQFPHQAAAYGWRGAACQHAGDLSNAKAHFTRALELDRRYSFGKRRLVDVLLQEQETDAAAGVLSRFRCSPPEDDDLALEVSVGVARRERDAASQAFHQLVTRRSAEPSSIDAALVALRGAGWEAVADPASIAATVSGETNPYLAEAWVAAMAQRREWRACRRTVARLASGSEIRRRALIAFLNTLGGARAGWELRRSLRVHDQELRADTLLWGSAGYALFSVGRLRAARSWLADWRNRSDAQPWMLFNLALAEMRQSGLAAALPAHEGALALAVRDHTTPLHAVRVAYGEALEGNYARAADLLAGVATAPGDPESETFRMLAEAMVGLGRAEHDFPWFRARAREARRTFLPVRAAHRWTPLARVVTRCAWRMAVRHGRWPDRLWALGL